MFRTTLSNVSQKRTLNCVYGYHQATPQAFVLSDDWDTSTADIYPGMVAQKAGGETVTLCEGGANEPAFGLFANFIAPSLGIDEVTDSDMNLVGVWVGGTDAQFEVIAPAWDNGLPADFWNHAQSVAGSTTAMNTALAASTGAAATDATQEVLLVAGSGTANKGKLCPQVSVDYTGAGDYAGHDIAADADPIARLIRYIDAQTILIGFIDR